VKVLHDKNDLPKRTAEVLAAALFGQINSFVNWPVNEYRNARDNIPKY
jgi:hypothetical protein